MQTEVRQPTGGDGNATPQEATALDLPGGVTVLDATPPKTKRVVAICGFAESTRHMANLEGKDVEIWSLNRCYTFLKRWDRWYEIHDEELYSGRTGLRERDYLDLLQKSKVPVFMRQPDPRIPMATLFPLNDILKAGFRNYFTTSIAYMVAHAIYEGCGELRLYGIDMSAFGEYSYQRPCVEFWLGMAEGRGIKVVIPKLSPVLKGPLYGDPSYRQMREMLDERMTSIKQKKSELSANLSAFIGALDEYSFWPELEQEPFTGKRKERHKALEQARNQTTADLNAALGQLRECQHWLTALAGGQKLSHDPEPVTLPGPR